MVTINPPRPKAVRTVCSVCEGSGRMPTEWDWPDFTPAKWLTCWSCLGRGVVLENAPASRERASVGG